MSDYSQNLFDTKPPYQAHSTTSFKAAALIEPTAASLRGQVLAFMRQAGTQGATDEEIQVAMEMNPSTQRPRRIELLGMGLIANSGETRLTRSGRRAVVWIAK